ncbi:hypothetical protein ACFXTO_031069 [Malus domestica]
MACLGKLVNSTLWHNRLGHPSNSVSSTMLKKSNIVTVHDTPSTLCQHCLEGKFSKLPFQSVQSKYVVPFEVIHSDLWGPAPCQSVDGFKYYVLFIDECTKFSWIFSLINKSDFFPTFVSFYHSVCTQFTTKIKTFQSDGGGEFISKKFQAFLTAQGVFHQLSCPYTPEQNGLAERKHRHIVETALTLLQTAHLSPSFWTYACHTATYLINRMPTPVLHNKSPFELLYNDVPDLSHLRVFGCSCYPLLKSYNISKLQPKTSRCLFLGYASHYKGYICYHLQTKTTYISRHVLFNELEFPFSSLPIYPTSKIIAPTPSLATAPLPTPTFQNILVSPISTSRVQTSSSVRDTSYSSPQGHAQSPSSNCQSPLLHTGSLHRSIESTDLSHSSSSYKTTTPPNSQSIIAASSSSTPSHVALDFCPETLQVVLEIPPMNLHPMQTQSKSGIVKHKALYASVCDSGGVDLTTTEPATYKSALKEPVWHKAMTEEIEALHSQGTWSIVDLPYNKNLVGCKWVFKIKRNFDGTIARYKARLVAKGFNQEHGLDYGETFSPVVKPTTVRLVLALAAHHDWPLHQLDVKNAFLHGFLQEEVYMSQPPGFEDHHHPLKVCRLHKSLYGLKQAPRAWNARFTSFLPTLGFHNTYADSSLFVKSSGSSLVILLLYVDDIILTGNDPKLITQVITDLTKEFDLKDLGSLHYFLGIQITRTAEGLFLSQEKYVHDLLQKTEMLKSKPCATPCLPYNRLLKDDGDPFNHPTLYRSIVGALQYLVFTRPDIAFPVNQVCQFMQSPMASHYLAVKRILRYLKGTMTHGIRYTKGSLSLRSFSDADWAGDPNDRRSTTGLVVFLGNNPISWASKKQQTVSRSSIEAEYRALLSTAAELDWLQQLFQVLQVRIPHPPVLFCDNLSAIALSFNPVQHQRTKHIEVDVHFVRERVASKKLLVQFVSSSEQVADILTKGLSSPLFKTHCNNLMLGPP